MKLYCPVHRTQLLILADEKNLLKCDEGCMYPVRNGIPTFVPADHYAGNFGIQWNKYRTTQLDSYTGFPISRDRLNRMLGDLELVRGKKVLEAGCGAGRFSEILLESGADLIAVDISSAVDAAYKNCKHFSNYSVYQADILSLPFRPHQFDIVICIGVIQHTPNPEQTITALCNHLKPGGHLIIDHYTHGYPATHSRRFIRSILLEKSDIFSLKFCMIMTKILWPIHVLVYKTKDIRFLKKLRRWFLNISPIVDYHYSYPQLGSKLLKVWAALDTHDTLTDKFKHLRSADEIKHHLEKCGMCDVEVIYAGNGVEAHARKAT